ncbi:MAG: LysM peptidoglycan-binding domain-containing protein [Spirochaetales bacterium]|nr:LysM peptidoglycan-binding domain-containing protein [Spirochaetales bacterium]
MMSRTIQRSGLPLLVFAAAVLVAAAGIAILVAGPFTEGLFRTSIASEAADESTPVAPPPPADDAPAPAEPAAPPDTAEPEPVAATQEPAKTTPSTSSTPATPSAAVTHTVVQGDTLFDLAGEYWFDPYLWPMLLAANPETVADPDYLRRGSVLNIPPRPDEAARAVADAHVEAYRRYRELGDEALSRGRAQGNVLSIQLGLIRVNKAHWVLYSGLRYDDDLLERAEGTVPRADLDTVRGFITQFGGKPGM